MSPNEMMEYRQAFDVACDCFGWKKVQVRQYHERDESRGWTELVWTSSAGIRLFAEDDLTEEMVKELIRLSDLVPAVLIFDTGE